VLPFKGNRLATGWQLSGIESWHAAVPFTVLLLQRRDGLGNNLATSRPSIIAECDITANQSRLDWFNPACFTLEAPGTLGNAGRNIGRSPS
jgi:hypothetical protein